MKDKTAHGNEDFLKFLAKIWFVTSLFQLPGLALAYLYWKLDHSFYLVNPSQNAIFLILFPFISYPFLWHHMSGAAQVILIVSAICSLVFFFYVVKYLSTHHPQLVAKLDTWIKGIPSLPSQNAKHYPRDIYELLTTIKDIGAGVPIGFVPREQFLRKLDNNKQSHILIGSNESVNRIIHQNKIVRVPHEYVRLVVAPSRAGKTSTIAIPQILEAPGQVVVTSTKPDILYTLINDYGLRDRIILFDPLEMADKSIKVKRLVYDILSGCSVAPNAEPGGSQLAYAKAEAIVEAAMGKAQDIKDGGYWKSSAIGILRICFMGGATHRDEYGTRVGTDTLASILSSDSQSAVVVVSKDGLRDAMIPSNRVVYAKTTLKDSETLEEYRRVMTEIGPDHMLEDLLELEQKGITIEDVVNTATRDEVLTTAQRYDHVAHSTISEFLKSAQTRGSSELGVAKVTAQLLTDPHLSMYMDATMLERVRRRFPDSPVEVFSPKDFVDIPNRKRGDILVILSDDSVTQLRPLINCFVYELIERTKRVATTTQERIQTPVLFILDELANITPIPNLDRLVSQAGGLGMSITMIVQNREQLTNQYGSAAKETIVGNATIEIILGGVKSVRDLQDYETLAGVTEVEKIAESLSDDMSTRQGLTRQHEQVHRFRAQEFREQSEIRRRIKKEDGSEEHRYAGSVAIVLHTRTQPVRIVTLAHYEQKGILWLDKQRKAFLQSFKRQEATQDTNHKAQDANHKLHDASKQLPNALLRQ
jgi:hypothetical protein